MCESARVCAPPCHTGQARVLVWLLDPAGERRRYYRNRPAVLVCLFTCRHVDRRHKDELRKLALAGLRSQFFYYLSR